MVSWIRIPFVLLVVAATTAAGVGGAGAPTQDGGTGPPSVADAMLAAAFDQLAPVDGGSDFQPAADPSVPDSGDPNPILRASAVTFNLGRAPEQADFLVDPDLGIDQLNDGLAEVGQNQTAMTLSMIEVDRPPIEGGNAVDNISFAWAYDGRAVLTETPFANDPLRDMSGVIDRGAVGGEEFASYQEIVDGQWQQFQDPLPAFAFSTPGEVIGFRSPGARATSYIVAVMYLGLPSAMIATTSHAGEAIAEALYFAKVEFGIPTDFLTTGDVAQGLIDELAAAVVTGTPTAEDSPVTDETPPPSGEEPGQVGEDADSSGNGEAAEDPPPDDEVTEDATEVPAPSADESSGGTPQEEDAREDVIEDLEEGLPLDVDEGPGDDSTSDLPWMLIGGGAGFVLLVGLGIYVFVRRRDDDGEPVGPPELVDTSAWEPIFDHDGDEIRRFRHRNSGEIVSPSDDRFELLEDAFHGPLPYSGPTLPEIPPIPEDTTPLLDASADDVVPVFGGRPIGSAAPDEPDELDDYVDPVDPIGHDAGERAGPDDRERENADLPPDPPESDQESTGDQAGDEPGAPAEAVDSRIGDDDSMAGGDPGPPVSTDDQPEETDGPAGESGAAAPAIDDDVAPVPPVDPVPVPPVDPPPVPPVDPVPVPPVDPPPVPPVDPVPVPPVDPPPLPPVDPPPLPPVDPPPVPPAPPGGPVVQEAEQAPPVVPPAPPPLVQCDWELWLGGKKLKPVAPGHLVCCVYRVEIETRRAPDTERVFFGGDPAGRVRIPGYRAERSGLGLLAEAMTWSAPDDGTHIERPLGAATIITDPSAIDALDGAPPDVASGMSAGEATEVTVALVSKCIDHQHQYTASAEPRTELSALGSCSNTEPGRECAVTMRADSSGGAEVSGDLRVAVRGDIALGGDENEADDRHHDSDDGRPGASFADASSAGPTVKADLVWSATFSSGFELNAAQIVPGSARPTTAEVESRALGRTEHSLSLDGQTTARSCEQGPCGCGATECTCEPSFTLVINAEKQELVADRRSFALSRGPNGVGGWTTM